MKKIIFSLLVAMVATVWNTNAQVQTGGTSPEITYDTCMYVAGSSTYLQAFMKKLPWTYEFCIDEELEFKQVKRVIKFEDGVAVDTTYTWYGCQDENAYMIQGNSSWKLDSTGTYNVHITIEDGGDYTFSCNAANGNFEVAWPGDPAPVARFYAKNNWDGGEEWTWKEMALDDPVYYLNRVVFGGTGVYINDRTSDVDALWYDLKTMHYVGGTTIRVNDTVNFTFNKIDSIFVAELVSRPEPAVSYLSPVYKTTGTPTSGIASWETLSCTTYTAVTSSQDTWGTSGNDSWYVVNANTTISSTVTCAGDVHLILMNNCTLNVDNIRVNDGDATLTIYAQDTVSNVMGVMNATNPDEAAGIGGGYEISNGAITINGGKITANGNGGGAGIGGGPQESGSNITINGGIVSANGGGNAAGIGGGNGGSGKYITINGGNVTATGGGDEAAGIGGGNSGSALNITINGGNVTATGANDGTGIGPGRASEAIRIYVADNILLKADNNNPPTTVIPHESITTDVTSSLRDKRYATAVEQTPAIFLTVGPSGYATIVTTDNLTVPSDVEVFGYTFDDFSVALIPGDAITAGEILPSGKGYVVKAAQGSYTFEFTSAAAGTTAKFESDLTGWTTDKAASEAGGTVYGLGIVGGKVGFYKFSGATIPAGKAVYVKPEN